jgi:hypothetical protein
MCLARGESIGDRRHARISSHAARRRHRRDISDIPFSKARLKKIRDVLLEARWVKTFVADVYRNRPDKIDLCSICFSMIFLDERKEGNST